MVQVCVGGCLKISGSIGLPIFSCPPAHTAHGQAFRRPSKGKTVWWPSPQIMVRVSSAVLTDTSFANIFLFTSSKFVYSSTVYDCVSLSSLKLSRVLQLNFYVVSDDPDVVFGHACRGRRVGHCA